MEEVPVVIVGAGPSGLAMGLSLAKYRIKSVILERELSITTDPRAVYLKDDAIRILWDLGVREQLKDLGHVGQSVNFHRSTFQAQPFYSIDMTQDLLHQALPMGIAHVQPKLESALVALVDASQFCELRRGCSVETHELLAKSMTVGYTDEQRQNKTIKCSWLIGADGKKGVVRKKFLEPNVGIKQEVGNYAYEGTWVAANLRITPPTRLSHPSLPFWDLDMTPDEVCDLYWPNGWHFCTPPGKATACGRFGPYKDRLWRHEFAEPQWNDSMDATVLFWEHISPMITRKKDGRGIVFPQGAVEFPRDCIELLRCRPFVFVQKCVSKWFDKRRILIGDSAHVFPPFGGEGMSSGLRDAHQLAWRIASVETASALPETAITRLLEGWEAERRRGIKDAVTFTKINGMLCNEPESWGFFIFRHLEYLYKCLPSSLQSTNARSVQEAKGLTRVRGGGFLAEYDGGGRLAQVFVKSGQHQVFRSDELLKHSASLLTLLVLGPGVGKKCLEAVKILDRLCLPATILSKAGLIALSDDLDNESIEEYANLIGVKPFSLTDSTTEDVIGDPSSYSPRPYLERLGHSTAFAILRPDFYIFALAKDAQELEQCMIKLRTMLK